jgi:chromosome partitioning protein
VAGAAPGAAAADPGWDVVDDEVVRPPKGTTHVVLDTLPACTASGWTRC